MANGMIAGIDYAWIAFRDSNGYPKGTLLTPDTPSTNTVYGAYRFKHPISYAPPTPTRELATRRGGGGIRGQRDLGLSDLGAGTIVFDAFDEAFHAYVSGSLVNTTTMTGWSMTTPNVQKGTLPSFVLGITIGFTNESGTQEFLTVIYNNVQIRPVMPASGDSGGTNPNPLTYEVVVDVSARYGIGRLYSASGMSVQENSDISVRIRYSREIYLVTFIGNNSATTTTLPFKPTSSDATGAATNSITVAGATTAVTSVATATGLVTFASAPASAAIVVIAYPTSYVTP
jgi:hypothetical protein